MSASVLLVEDEPTIRRAVSLRAAPGGLRGRGGRRREPRVGAEPSLRRRHPRPEAPRRSRARTCCAGCGRPARSDHRADRARHRDRPGARARARRRRLHDEAVLDDGAHQPRARDPAPVRARRGAGAARCVRSAACGSTSAPHAGRRRQATGVPHAVAVQAARAAREEPGRVVTRREIMQRLWDSSHVGDEHVCDVHVSNLRHKIEPDPSSRSGSSRCAGSGTSSSRSEVQFPRPKPAVETPDVEPLATAPEHP